DEETAYSTARCRDWHLSADVGDFRSHNRCGTGSLVRWTWSLDAEPRACAATRNARGIGIDCRRSIWGVINAGLIVGFSKDAPIALVPENFAPAPWLGVIGFVGSIVWLYGWMLRRSRAVVSGPTS